MELSTKNKTDKKGKPLGPLEWPEEDKIVMKEKVEELEELADMHLKAAEIYYFKNKKIFVK